MLGASELVAEEGAGERAGDIKNWSREDGGGGARTGGWFWFRLGATRSDPESGLARLGGCGFGILTSLPNPNPLLVNEAELKSASVFR